MLLVFPFALPIINAVIDTYTHSVTHIHRERERASLTCECCQQLEGSVVAMAAPARHQSSLTHYYQTTFTSSPYPPPSLPPSLLLSDCLSVSLADWHAIALALSEYLFLHLNIFQYSSARLKFVSPFSQHTPLAPPSGPRPARLPNFFGFPALFA